MPHSSSRVIDYHDGTKHHFRQFARSLGYLDWGSQPEPFRHYGGASSIPLCPSPGASAPASRWAGEHASYGQLVGRQVPPEPLSAPAVGTLLRYSLGLSAWKRVAAARWSLRVNPSSGNLHPTEAYIVAGPLTGLSDCGGVYHYRSQSHELEVRCRVTPPAWTASDGPTGRVLVALTSIHWREAWKYGERAFRYCQHDIGHAVGAISFAAAALGWEARLLPEWSHADVAALCGLDRDGDFFEAEREEPACVLAVGPPQGRVAAAEPAALVDAVRRGEWSGQASPAQPRPRRVDVHRRSGSGDTRGWGGGADFTGLAGVWRI